MNTRTTTEEERRRWRQRGKLSVHRQRTERILFFYTKHIQCWRPLKTLHLILIHSLHTMTLSFLYMVFVRKMDSDYILRLDFLLSFQFLSIFLLLLYALFIWKWWCLVRLHSSRSRLGFNNNVARKSPFWVSLLQPLFHFDPLLYIVIMLKISSVWQVNAWRRRKRKRTKQTTTT